MSQSLGKAAVDIVAESKPFLDAFKGLGGQVGKHAEDLGQKFSDGFARMFSVKNLVGMFTGGLTAGGLGLLLKQTVDAGDNLDEMSQKLAISVENLQRLRYVSGMSGVSLEGLTVAIKTFATNQVKAGIATGSMTDMLAKAADQFQRMADGPAKTAKAVELFGRSGLDMIPLLNQGSEAILRQMKLFDAMGGVMSAETAAAAGKLNDNLDTLKVGLMGVANTAAAAVIPALAEVAEKMVDWWKANQDVINQGMKTVIDDLKVSITGLIDPITKATTGTTGLAGAFEYIGALIKIPTEGLLGLQLALTGGAWLEIQIPIHFLDSLSKSLQTLQRAVNFVFNPTGVSAGNIPLVDAISKYLLGPLENLSAKLGNATENLRKSMIDVFFPLDFMLGHVPVVGTGNEDPKKDKPELPTTLKKIETALKGTTPAWIADYEAMSMWAAVAADIQGMIASGALGQGMAWTMENIIGGAGGPVQRDMSGLGKFSPGWNYEGGGPGLNPSETVGMSLFGVPSLGSAVQSWMDTAAMVNTAPMSDLLNGILDQQAFFGMTWGEVAGNIGDSISAFFSDAVVNGFAGGAKKFIAALAGMFGQILSKMGTALIGQGTAEIVMGMAPPPFGPRPDLIAHGKMSIIKGALLAAGGGLITGLSSAIGGTSGGSSGESFQSGIARPYTTTQQATPINYNIGGKDVNIRIVAWDGESVKSWVDSGGDRIIQDAVSSGVKSNSKLREDIRHGISWNS